VICLSSGIIKKKYPLQLKTNCGKQYFIAAYRFLYCSNPLPTLSHIINRKSDNSQEKKMLEKVTKHSHS